MAAVAPKRLTIPSLAGTRLQPQSTVTLVSAPALWSRNPGSWATAEGMVTLTGPGTDPHGREVEALVDYYRMAAGEHPDWEEYRSVMVSDRRVLIAMAVDHVYGANIR